MQPVNIKEWKDFVIGDLFEKLKLDVINPSFSKSLDVSETRTEEFCLPLVNAKHENNGIMYYGRPSDFETASMTIDIVQNGAIATGDVYPQPQETGVLWDAYLIKLKQNIESKYVLMFLSAVIEKAIKDRFSYDDKCTWDKAKVLTIKLPIDANGDPDWDYMETYMMSIVSETEDALSYFRFFNNEKQKLDIARWKDFVIEDLFEKLDLKNLNSDFNKAFDISEEQTEEFCLPLVNAKHNNNGIMYYGREQDFESETMTIDIVADGAASTGDVYAQPQRTGVLYNAYLVKSKTAVSESVLFFLATVMRRCIKQFFSYDNKCTWDSVKKKSIKLPTSPDGKPDWIYMESYMQNIMSKADLRLNALKKVVV